MAGNGGFLPGDPHSPNAQRIQDAFIFVAIFTGRHLRRSSRASLIAFIIKYRRGKRPRTTEGPQIHGSTRLEIIWTVRPGRDPRGDRGVRLLRAARRSPTRPKASAADETTITVEGHQFYWLFRYPNGAVSIDRMIAPADEVVHEDVSAPDYDVIHSLVGAGPRRQVRRDPRAGRTRPGSRRRPASYVARCAELCGIQHALMDGGRRRRAARPSTTRSSPSAPRTRAAPRSARRSGTGVCQKCHRLDHAVHRAGARRQPAARRPRRDRDAAAARPRQRCRPSAANWTRRPDRRARRVHEAVRVSGAAA